MPSPDSGERIYAIGDVHGRYDLLQILLAKIRDHSDSLPPTPSLYVIIIGDMIDRGPQSAEVLALVHDLHRTSDHVIALLGNHEDAMLQALDGDVDALRGWLAVGGGETLASFGIARLQPGEDPHAYIRRARDAVPRDWIAWLRRLPLSVRSGDYHFVHAGIRPGISLDSQTRADMLWIREDFLSDSRDHGAVVVHGHTITATVQMCSNRIGIDTGAYRTHHLSALYLEGTNRDVLVT